MLVAIGRRPNTAGLGLDDLVVHQAAVHGGGVETRVGEGARDDLAAFLERAAALLHEQAFLDDVGDGHARAERAIGVLKDDLHVAPQRSHRFRIEPVDAATEIENRPVGADQS